MPSKQQLHMSLLTKANSQKYLDSLPPLNERKLKEPFYERQWWETPYSFSLFTRYYLIQGGKRSIPEVSRLFLADNNKDFSPDVPVIEQIDPKRNPNRSGDTTQTWVYYHANAKDPFTGEDLEGEVMTWEDRAAYFDLDQVMQSRSKMTVYRDKILQDELQDYVKLKNVVDDLIGILQERIVDFKKQASKKGSEYSSLMVMAREVVGLRDTIDKFARRGVGLPERISEDRFAEAQQNEFKIDWVEPFELPDGNNSINGEIIVLDD